MSDFHDTAVLDREFMNRDLPPGVSLSVWGPVVTLGSQRDEFMHKLAPGRLGGRLQRFLRGQRHRTRRAASAANCTSKSGYI